MRRSPSLRDSLQPVRMKRSVIRTITQSPAREAVAAGSTSTVRCDALLLDEHSRSDTYPTMEIDAEQVNIGHEASISRLGEDQLFYLMSRGISEEEAAKMVVNGFVEPIVKELPMEYAIELNRLIELQMEGSVG